MNRRAFLKTAAALPAVAALAELPPFASGAGAQPKAFAPRPGTWRTFEIVTRVEVVSPSGVTRVWIPLPAVTSDYQAPIENSWTGFSEQPGFVNAREVGTALIKAFVAGADDTEGHPGADGVHGVDELHIVSTRFRSLMTQSPDATLLAPMEIEEREATEVALLPEYEFEPDAEELLDALLPKYINTRIYAALLDSAASESASRRRAMKSATDNADDMVRRLTREMNSARQAAITQEISEIVGGANALAAAGSEV